MARARAEDWWEKEEEHKAGCAWWYGWAAAVEEQKEIVFPSVLFVVVRLFRIE